MKKIIKMIAALAAISLITALLALFPTEKNPGEDETFLPAADIDYTDFASGKALVSDSVLISAKSAILCTSDGDVIFEKEADIPLPMASITKLMTAVVVLENVPDISKKITVPKEAVGVEGSSVYLKTGEIVDLEMLLYSAMLESANDATLALAISVLGSEEAFVSEMNEKAKELGMASTVFKNPHGLPCDGHYTTCRDYAKLMAYALKNEALCKIISTKKKIYPSSDGSLTRVLTNHNRLLNTYSGMIGGKTGFTKSSGRTLVTAAEKDGTQLICVTINAPSDWDDHTKMFDLGFDLLKTESFSPNGLALSVKLAGGNKDKVNLEFQPFSLTVPKECKINIKYVIPHMIFAPSEKEKEVGRIICELDGEIIKEQPLYLAEDCVSSTEDEKTPGWIEKISEFFKNII